MEIVLVRHGKPGPVPMARISGFQIGRWVRDYDRVGISRASEPPEAVRHLASASPRVLASDLRRSIESAVWLSSPDRIQIEADLREAVLPDSLGLHLRLPPAAWVIIARIAWWLNRCPSSESVEATRQRASRAADRLCALSREHGTVLMVGHGMFNRFIAVQLSKRGWRGPRFMRSGYWSTSRFVWKPSVSPD